MHTEVGRSQVEVQWCTLSWAGPRLRSSGAHWAGKVPGWGPAVPTELGRSQVEVQRCTLSSDVGEELGEELARQQWTWKWRQRWWRRCWRTRSRRSRRIWYVCVHSACMDHQFWHILTMWDWEHVFSKILWPKLPAKRPQKSRKRAQKSRKRAQKLSNARKNCQTRANPDFWSFRVIWVVLQRTHFWPCLKDNEFNRSHAHSVCLGLPIKQQGLQPRTEPLFWIDGFQMGQSWCPQHVSSKIALFSFYDFKSLRFSMKRLIALNA